jgi:hypothetical protein
MLLSDFIVVLFSHFRVMISFTFGIVMLGVVLVELCSVWYSYAGCGMVMLGVVLLFWVRYSYAGCGIVMLGVV